MSEFTISTYAVVMNGCYSIYRGSEEDLDGNDSDRNLITLQ